MSLLKKGWVAWGLVVIISVATLLLGTYTTLRTLRDDATDILTAEEAGGSVYDAYEQILEGGQAVCAAAGPFLGDGHAALSACADSLDHLELAEDVSTLNAAALGLFDGLQELYDAVKLVEETDVSVVERELASVRQSGERINSSAYNQHARRYNEAIEAFPASAFSRLFGLTELELLQPLALTIDGAGVPSGDSADYEAGSGPFEAVEYMGAFEAAGLPVYYIEDFDETTDPNGIIGTPNGYYGKATCNDSRLWDRGAFDDELTVEVFYTVQDAEARRVYLEEVYAAMSTMRMYILTSPDGLAILRLSQDFTQEEVAEYETVFNEFCLTGSVTPVEDPPDIGAGSGDGGGGEALDYALYITDSDNIVVFLTNTAPHVLGEITVEATFFDGGTMLASSSETLYSVPAGRELAFILSKPRDTGYNVVPFTDVEINVRSDPQNYFVVVEDDDLAVTHSLGSASIVLRVTNQMSTAISYVKLAILYYDADDTLMGASQGYVGWDIAPGASVTETSIFAGDYVADPAFDHYEVLILEILAY